MERLTRIRPIFSGISAIPGHGLEIQNAVRYDWQAAVKAALQNGRPDWAEWLKTGAGLVLPPLIY